MKKKIWENTTKKKLILVGLVIILVSFFSVASYSYFIDVKETPIVNEIGVGRLRTELIEEFEPIGDEGYKPVPAGTEIKKIVQVKSYEKNVDCYIRCFAEFEDEHQAEFYDVDFNTKDWEKSGDYWYYKYKVKEGETTTPLMTRLKTRKKGEAQLGLIIYSESVQALEYTDPKAAFEQFN